MFLVEWLYGILAMLGLATKEPKRSKKMRGWCQPTQYLTSEELVIAKIKFTAFDLGGHWMARIVWRGYCTKVDAVVCMVDAADKDRFLESKIERDALLADEPLANAPFLVLGNKIDIPCAASEDEFRYYQGLANCTAGKGGLNYSNTSIRPIELLHVQHCSQDGLW